MDNIFQSPEWEKFKLATGYQKSYRVDEILILQKNLPFGFSMLYSPMVDKSRAKNVESRKFATEISEIAHDNNAIFFRAEFDTDNNPSLLSALDSLHYIKSFEEMQPEHTLILDLTKSESEILAQMKQKCRYNLKIADRGNVKIKQTDKIDDFYKMYQETGQRHHITYRARSYFDNLLEILGESGYCRVYGAYLGETPITAAIIVYSGKTAIYMFGASSNEHRNLMAPYKLQWQIIRDAKAKGCNTYDFFGIAPEDQPNHPWAGVTRFKKQFGGRYQVIAGSYDLVFRPTYYQLFKFAEKIRR